ncbi:hypothetical protein BKA83DRAFT_3174819 [Pisolithus microcarpus]|nr:hypothetical protein BKA83DRAFT_3174819 [Pisolithus microcarpus]
MAAVRLYALGGCTVSGILPLRSTPWVGCHYRGPPGVVHFPTAETIVFCSYSTALQVLYELSLLHFFLSKRPKAWSHWTNGVFLCSFRSLPFPAQWICDGSELPSTGTTTIATQVQQAFSPTCQQLLGLIQSTLHSWAGRRWNHNNCRMLTARPVSTLNLSEKMRAHSRNHSSLL